VIPRARIDGFIDRHKRLLTVVFWVIAVVATAMAWAGKSFREVLGALTF
jgi:hypothetical protein